MTYLQFHLLFNLPAMLLLLWLARWRLRPVHGKWLLILCGIVVTATTPWDNWAVHCGIWTFDWPRTHPLEVNLGGVLWRLPLEEYAFFVIETMIVVLLTLLFLPRPPVEPRA